jgi:hypothetical protein
MANAPSPIKQTDADLVTEYLASQGRRQERNVNDPNEWIYVGNHGPNGDQPWAPDFVNGFFNVGPPRCLIRYRFLRPYDPDTTQNAVQLQGSYAGGSHLQTIFTIGHPFWQPDGTVTLLPVQFDSAIYLTCCDDSEAAKVVTIKTNGDVVDGFV